jgi:hypothetical protein
MIHIYNFCKLIVLLSLALKTKRLKKLKTYVINVSQNHILHPFPVWEVPFCQKKSKSLCPTVHTLQAPPHPLQPRPHNFPASVSDRREKAEI